MMIQFRPGSHACSLAEMLSVVGEYPAHSVRLLGNERVYKALIHKLTTVQAIRNSQTETEITCRMINISGKGRTGKSIRLYKAALPILEWIHPDALQQYLNASRNHHFSGDLSHVNRNHRVAEATAMCMRAGIEYRPYMLPALQNRKIAKVIPDKPVFYLAKALKDIGENEMNKTMFTRMVGAIFSDGKCYVVYNTRNSVMKWNGMGEFKTLHSLIEIGRLNAGVARMDSAILFGESDSVAFETLMASEENKRLEFRFDSIYKHIHFIPMNEFGIRLLRLLAVPNWNEKLMDLLFEKEERSYNQGVFEYDAFVDGKYVLAYLDSDIARLIRFKSAILTRHDIQAEILCFPHQVLFIREYLGSHTEIKTIPIDAVEAEFT